MAAAVLVGALSAYIDETLFDSRTFSNRAVSVLDNDAVQAELANAITDAAIDEVPNAVAARPLLQSVSEGLVRSTALQSLLRQGIEDVHATVVVGNQDTLTVTLENIGTLIRSGLQTAAPKLADQVSRKLNVNLLAGDDGATLGLVVDAAQLHRDLRAIRWVALAVGLLAAFGSVGLAATRLTGLRRLGRAIAGGGVLGLLAWFAGRSMLVGHFDDTTAAAVVAVYDAFAADLMTWLLVVTGAGLVLTAGVSSTREPLDVAALSSRAWRRLVTAPSSTAARAARAVLLVAAGLWILANRDLVLDLTALAVGGFVVYVGAAELMRLAAGAVRVDAGTDPARSDADLSGGALARIGLVGIALLGTFVALGVGANDEETPPIEVDTCNGSIELCDRSLEQVAFAGTHNSMSAATYDNWFFAQQEKGITQQLDDGIRALLIDPHYAVQTSMGVATDLEKDTGSRAKIEAGLGPDGVAAAEALRKQIGYEGGGKTEIFLCHAFCEVGAITFQQGLGEIRDFLLANPGEVVIVSIEDATQPADTTAEIEKAGLGGFLYRGPNGPPWPTLRELIDSNQRLVVMAERDGGDPEWYRRQFAVTQETPFSFSRPEQLERPSSCDPNRGLANAQFFLLNHWVDTSPAPRPTNAKIVNKRQFLLDRIEMCEQIRGLRPNIIAVDFYREGDVLGVVDELNRTPPG